MKMLIRPRYNENATILARVYASDDGHVRPKHLIMRYMKDENKCCI
jgi:hypothetical protein